MLRYYSSLVVDTTWQQKVDNILFVSESICIRQQPSITQHSHFCSEVWRRLSSSVRYGLADAWEKTREKTIMASIEWSLVSAASHTPLWCAGRVFRDDDHAWWVLFFICQTDVHRVWPASITPPAPLCHELYLAVRNFKWNFSITGASAVGAVRNTLLDSEVKILTDEVGFFTRS